MTSRRNPETIRPDSPRLSARPSVYPNEYPQSVDQGPILRPRSWNANRAIHPDFFLSGRRCRCWLDVPEADADALVQRLTL